MERQAKFDHLVIETTGLAAPAPVVQTFFVDEAMKAKTHLESVVTVVDVKHVLEHWDAKEVQEQLLFANVILLNKVDLVSAEDLANLEQRIRAVNRIASLDHTRNSEKHSYILQGIHTLISQTHDRAWHPNEIRKNELVLIGRNLDETALQQEFLACFVQS
jgi:G3E family GTPase